MTASSEDGDPLPVGTSGGGADTGRCPGNVPTHIPSLGVLPYGACTQECFRRRCPRKYLHVVRPKLYERTARLQESWNLHGQHVHQVVAGARRRTSAGVL